MEVDHQPPQDEQEMDVCPICWESISASSLTESGPESKLVNTPCSHVYHDHCLRAWFHGGQRTCPICRQVMEPNDVAFVTIPGSSSSSLDFKEVGLPSAERPRNASQRQRKSKKWSIFDYIPRRTMGNRREARRQSRTLLHRLMNQIQELFSGGGEGNGPESAGHLSARVQQQRQS